MREFKTVDTNNAIQRVVCGQLRVCSVDDDKNYEVELLLLNEKPNQNSWQYTKIAEHLDDIADTPILFSHTKGNHAFVLKKDKRTGKEYASFVDADSEKPVGWIPKTIKGEKNARIVNINGVEWLSARGILPKFYNKELIDELETNGGEMSVSIETLVFENHFEGDIEVEDKYTITGTTILKQGVAPAVKGAQIKKMSFDETAMEKIKVRVASLAESDFIEPQTQKTKNQKGETRTMAKVYRMDELKDKFPNYTVLGVNGNNVALLSSKGRTCSYTFLENEGTVVPERIEEIAVNSIFGNGEGAVSVSAETLVGEALAQLNAAQKALETKTNECVELQCKIDKMNATETERRKKVVKEAIEGKLNELMEHCEGIDSKTCDDMLTDAKIAEYATMEDEHGFCGDKAAEKEVNSRCMEKILALEKTKSKNNHYSWTDTVHGIVADEEQDDILENVKNILD